VAHPDHPAVRRVVEAAARKGVELEVTIFSESTHTAEDAARAVGAELGQIVKSLVFVALGAERELEPVLCLVSGPNRVDVAQLAAVTGKADIRRATAREANELTGYVIGGIPPIGHARPIRAVMDDDLTRFTTVWAAAGTPNAVFPVPPATLRILANATVAPIAEAPEDAREAGVGSAQGEIPAGQADSGERATPDAGANAAAGTSPTPGAGAAAQNAGA
jgi:prolyl-tRNA editing enzyme YbaK/EbsC (Cys-tRNA(Pro) deacylase)